MKKMLLRTVTSRLNNRKGFTLVEMLIMLGVIGLIAGLMFSVMGNTFSESATKADAIKIADGARQITDGSQNYQAQKGSKATLATVVSSGMLTALPQVPTAVGTAWAFDATTWTPKTVLTLSIPDAAVTTCQKINELYAGAAEGAAVPAAIDTAKDLQCSGAAGAYKLTKLVYPN